MAENEDKSVKTEDEVTDSNVVTTNKENKIVVFFKKIGSTIWKWLKSGLKWIIMGLAIVLSVILFKKIDHVVQTSDEKKKQKAKDDSSNTTSKIEESETKINDIKSDVKTAKSEVSDEKEALKKSNKTYKEKQVETATEAGFTKD